MSSRDPDEGSHAGPFGMPLDLKRNEEPPPPPPDEPPPAPPTGPP